MSPREDQPATVPPPAGEDDAYSAATKVGAMPAEVMARLRAEGLLPDEAEGQPPPEPPPPAAPVPRPPATRRVTPFPGDGSLEEAPIPVLRSIPPPPEPRGGHVAPYEEEEMTTAFTAILAPAMRSEAPPSSGHAHEGRPFIPEPAVEQARPSGHVPPLMYPSPSGPPSGPARFGSGSDAQGSGFPSVETPIGAYSPAAPPSAMNVPPFAHGSLAPAPAHAEIGEELSASGRGRGRRLVAVLIAVLVVVVASLFAVALLSHRR